MGDFLRVEDLQVYQKLCHLHIDVCNVTKSWPSDERFELTCQIRRSSNSAPANLAEKHSDRHIKNKIEGVNSPAPFWEDEAVANEFLFHDCEPEIARAAFGRLRPEPGVLGREVSPLQQWPAVPCGYIVCSDDRTATPVWARRSARERLGVEPIELPGGHCPMLSRPEQLAEVLVRYA